MVRSDRGDPASVVIIVVDIYMMETSFVEALSSWCFFDVTFPDSVSSSRLTRIYLIYS